ncbi:hypothetical protein NQZ68_023693 [Dissostichus eleginoides]|nr:hypothetical protein NQZ68_023693 [Dissostichus eleginoides]
MTGALKVFLLLLQGSLCLKWEITMPLRIDGLTGSCVKVPCTFDFDSQFDGDLDDSCKAIWIRGSMGGTVVFDSSLTGDQASGNILQGNLTGNLQNKECTTIFYNMPPSHSDNYYFRIECNNSLRLTYTAGVRITIQNSLDQPTITPSTLEVEEGALVTLSCTAVAPCPILPPDLTWTPGIGDIEEKHEFESMVSVMNFTSSYLNNGQNFSCTALYKRQAGNTDLRFETFVTLHVLCGSLCLNGEITMPLRIDGLTGSCVKVPCTFDFDSKFDGDLDDSCKAIWKRGSTRGTVVFDSSLTGDQARGNILQGNLTGNLQNKECTTIFYNMPPSHSDNYYFRIECNNSLRLTYTTGVRITIQSLY